jgi:membrane-bound lytic murein transglycosylase D
VPRAAHAADVAEHIADHGTLVLAPDLPPLRRIYLKAGRKGDSVAAVARRYRVNAGQLAQWNGLGVGGRFKAGQRIVVMLPATRGPAARASANIGKGKKVKAAVARGTGKRARHPSTTAAPSNKKRATQKAPR